MFGLDEKIASLASTKPLVALAVALLLGLRHPLDPDHLAAVAAMARESRRRSTLIGLCWGAGHATTVLALGVPVVLWTAALPESVHQTIEALIGVVIFALGLRLLIHHHRGDLHAHPHRPPNSLREAYGVGVVHGAGGSAAIGLLILAAIPDHGVALACSAAGFSTRWSMFGYCSGPPAGVLITRSRGVVFGGRVLVVD